MVQNGPFRRISYIFKIAGLEPKLLVMKSHHQKQSLKAHISGPILQKMKPLSLLVQKLQTAQ